VAEMFAVKALRPLQETVVALAEREFSRPTLVLIEAPMGEGKTEAAFYLHDQFQERAGQRGMYVALPTQATSNQMFERTVKFLARRYPTDKVNLHLAHGQASLDERYAALRLACEDESEPETGGRVVAEEWFTPKKRALLSPFAVGTVDQALLSVLQVRHGFVRLFALAGKVVVIDEVHAYDTYTSTLLDRLIEWLSELGSSVVLLSATLPRRRRTELLKAYTGVDDGPVTETSYPRITWVSRDKRPESVQVEARKQPPFKLRRFGPKAGAVARELVETIGESGGCAAWVCNTVAEAQSVYNTLKDMYKDPGIKLSLLHSRFPYEERHKRELEALNDFGKDSLKREDEPGYHPRPDKAILVATQIIEQSLDLDFDVMISRVAPIDLLLQRLGRVHRHEGRVRPRVFPDPELWLLEPETGADGLPEFGFDSKIYDEYVLIRSWLALREIEHIHIPGQIEELIEKVYDPQGLCARDAELPVVIRDGLDRAWRDAEQKRQDDTNEAKKKIILSPRAGGNLNDHFNADLKDNENPEVKPKAQAATRLCRPSVSLLCLYDASDGAISIDPQGRQVVDPVREPDLETTRALLLREVKITHPAIVGHFLERNHERPGERGRPLGWRSSPHLRHHRPAVFRNGICAVEGGWSMRLHAELGIVILKGAEEVDQED
ncbi:MAG: CRISPR-associated helicase Cas3', partial [Actinobacteria bacterium]|nr:CRISPR-associated helicase Cas3' [Actinomycetota bacterium]